MNLNTKPIELKKHVGLIHCSNPLTLLQRKISNVLLYKAYDDLLTKERHQITIGELNKLIGYKSNDYNTIKGAIKALISTVLEWNLLGDGLEKDGHVVQKIWHASSMLASARINGAICTYSYSPELRELLFMPEIYSKLNLLIQTRFKSSYTLVLYENCLRYKNLTYTRWFAIPLFRKLMGVIDGKYTAFKELNRKVINKAINEINKFSDILIDSEVQKHGKKVAAVRFKVTEKKISINCDDEIPTVKEKTVISSLLTNEFGFSKKQTAEVFTKYSLEYIEEKIKLIKESKSYKDGLIANLAAYLLRSLKDDYQNPISSKSSKKLKINPKEEFNNIQKDNEKTQLKNRYLEYVSSVIEQSFQACDDTQRANIIAAFEGFLQLPKNSIILGFYKKRNFQSRPVKGFFQKFLQDNYPQIIPTILDFESYIKG